MLPGLLRRLKCTVHLRHQQGHPDVTTTMCCYPVHAMVRHVYGIIIIIIIRLKSGRYQVLVAPDLVAPDLVRQHGVLGHGPDLHSKTSCHVII